MKYSAINAKIKGMDAKLLSYEDYLGLCECVNTQDVSQKLKSYGVYPHINGTGLDRDYAKIRGFINNSDIRRYLEALLLKRESGLYYYTNLWKAQKRFLKGVNKDIATAVHGTEIDMQNIIRIYRLKTHYKPMKELIYKYILPINYKISSEMIMKMIEADNERTLLALIKSTCYGKHFLEKQNDQESIYEAQSLVYRRVKKKYSNSIAPIICYLFKKEMEIKNITSILEGVRYSLAPHEIMNKIRIEARR